MQKSSKEIIEVWIWSWIWLEDKSLWGVFTRLLFERLNVLPEEFSEDKPVNINFKSFFTSVQSFSHVWLFATPWTAACQASLSITNSWNLLKLTSIELVMPSNHLILCCPLLLLPSIFPSIRGFFQGVSSLHQMAKVLQLQLQLSPSNEYLGLISFRIYRLDLLAVLGTLKSLLQHYR